MNQEGVRATSLAASSVAMSAPNCRLLIDTSGEQMLLGMIHEGNLVFAEHMDGHRQIEAINLQVQSLLKGFDLEVSAISSIGVVVGPGSMAGLRVGVTFAKALSYALGCGITPLLSHEVIASIFADGSDPVVVLRRVRKQEAFGAICTKGSMGLTTISGPTVLGPNELEAWLSRSKLLTSSILAVSDRAPEKVLEGVHGLKVVDYHLPSMLVETCESMSYLMDGGTENARETGYADVAIAYVRGADTRVSYQRLNSSGDLEWVKD